MRLIPLRAPTPGEYQPFALIWLGVFLAVALVVGLIRLPERMECSGHGRYGHCKYGLLSPELWRHS